MMELDQQLDSIKSRQDLVRFIHALLSDYEHDPESWQNRDIAAYFDALAAWIEDTDGYLRHIGEAVPEIPSWKFFGEMLIAAKYYE